LLDANRLHRFDGSYWWLQDQSSSDLTCVTLKARSFLDGIPFSATESMQSFTLIDSQTTGHFTIAANLTNRPDRAPTRLEVPRNGMDRAFRAL
jgi:hypothetical protein